MTRRTAVFGAALIALVFAGCGEDAARDETSRYADDDPETQLAGIDHETPVPSDDEIQPYARALDLLNPKCTNPRPRLADFAVGVVQQAADRNVKTSTLNVLRNVRRSIPEEFQRRGCSDIFAAYLTVLTAPDS